MKKFKLYAIFVMAMAIIVTVAVVSCKKETTNALIGNKNESVQTFNPREIEDMNAYLKDFKQKMKSAAKGEDEALSIEDAAWHLSSLANYEFANANVECDDVRFDTLHAQINITDGSVFLSDLASAYQTISSSIDKFYNSLALDNKHFRFIDAYISENGEVAIPLLTTFSHGSRYITNHLWYFDDLWELVDLCDSIFPDTIVYSPQTTGRTVLQEELNKVVSHPYSILQIPLPSQIVYYTKASEMVFDYEHYTDPYGSTFYNSRLFNHGLPFLYDLGVEMCYLYDSYLGLGFDNCPTDQEIVSWELEYGKNQAETIEFHKLKVIYGTRHGDPAPGNNDD